MRLSRWILEEPPTWTSERNNLGERNFSRWEIFRGERVITYGSFLEIDFYGAINK